MIDILYKGKYNKINFETNDEIKIKVKPKEFDEMFANKIKYFMLIILIEKYLVAFSMSSAI